MPRFAQSEAYLKKIGSRHLDAKKRAEAAGAEIRPILPSEDWPEPKIPKTKRGFLSLFRKHLPGYDPEATAAEVRFNVPEAIRRIEYFHYVLSHVKGEKGYTPFYLEPWQQAIVASLFGYEMKRAIRPGVYRWLRRYNQCFLMVARGNGKTALAGGIALCVLDLDEEPGAECFSAALNQKQSTLVYSHAAGMVNQSEYLQSRMKVQGGTHIIKALWDLSFYRAIARSDGGAHGLNPQLLIIDETHNQPDREFVDGLETGTGKRRSPIILHTTTSDYDRPGSICNEKCDYAKKVIDGTFDDPSFLPVIYDSEPDEDWTKQRTWRKANPNLGVSVSIEYLKRECRKAQENPSYENTFRRLHLNQRTGQSVRWIPMDKWSSQYGRVDEADLYHVDCWGGLDLATTSDITCLVLCWPIGEFVVWRGWYWVPEKTAGRRARKDRLPYLEWIKTGLMKETPGDGTDYETVRRDVNVIAETYQLKTLAVDRLFQGYQLSTELKSDGLDVVAFGMGFVSMASPCKRLEHLWATDKLDHGNDPILRWMASNVAVEMDAAGNLKPSKKESSEKIDGIVAGLMALAVMDADEYREAADIDTDDSEAFLGTGLEA